MLTPLLLLWPVSLALTWLVAQGLANKPFDRALEYNAHALAQLVGVSGNKVQFNLPQPASEILRADESDIVYSRVLGPGGEFLSGERELPEPPADEVPMSGEVRLRDGEMRGIEIRVAYIWVRLPLPDTPVALVQVAETREKRSVLATEIIKGVMLPQFVILPLAVLLVWLALARGLPPLQHPRHTHRQPAAGAGARRGQWRGFCAPALRPGPAHHRGGARLFAPRPGKAHRPGLRRCRAGLVWRDARRQPHAAQGTGAQPGGQRPQLHPFHARQARRGHGPRAGRHLWPCAAAAGRRLRPRRARGLARAGVPAVLPCAGQRGRRLRSGPAHRAGDCAQARCRGHPGRRTPGPAAAGRALQRAFCRAR